MPNQITTPRDLKFAVLLGVGTELLIILRALCLRNEIAEGHRWLYMSQTPGNQIAVELFRFWKYGGYVADAFAGIIQSVLFTLIALGSIYAFRIIRRTKSE